MVVAGESAMEKEPGAGLENQQMGQQTGPEAVSTERAEPALRHLEQGP